MKVDDAVETISRFFNDLIGSLVPGAVLAVGLAVMHLGPGKIVEGSKALDSAALALTVVGLMFAAGHALMAGFEVALQPLLKACQVVKAFDEVEAKKRQSFEVFAEIVNKLRGFQCGCKYAEAFRVVKTWPNQKAYRLLPPVQLGISQG